MPLGNIGQMVSTVGCVLGFTLIIFGGFVYLIENKNRVLIAKSLKTIGIGILIITTCIPFSIPSHLLEASTSVSSAIILSVFLGSPLLLMGLASYIGLKAKALQILNLPKAQEKVIYFSPVHKKKVF